MLTINYEYIIHILKYLNIGVHKKYCDAIYNFVLRETSEYSSFIFFLHILCSRHKIVYIRSHI